MENSFSREDKGSITVFLSLTLVIILSLIMTVLEGARVNTARVFAERALTTAMDSVLAEFYEPLFKEYHILGLDAGYGSNVIRTETIEDRLDMNTSYTLTPNRDLSYSTESIELYDSSLAKVKVVDYTSLMDYQGELFINEAVEYMKYRELGDGLGLILNKLSVMEKPEKVSILYEEKLKVEEELVAIDEGILKLMKLYDGISTDKKGLKVNKDGTLQTLKDYIKKICYGEASQDKVGINNEKIYESIAENYIDPTKYFSNAEQSFMFMEQILEAKAILDIEAEGTALSLVASEEKLVELEAKLELYKKDKEAAKNYREQIRKCKEQIEALSSQYNEIQIKLNVCNENEGLCLEALHLIIGHIRSLTDSIQPLITEADQVIDNILETSEKADPLISDYEASLSSAKEELWEMVTSLEEGLQELKRYKSTETSGYDFLEMKQELQHNLSVLTTVNNYIHEAENALNIKDYDYAKESFQKADSTLTSYSTKKLTLEYSTVVLRKESDMDPLGNISALIKEGLAGLVIEPTKVSTAELKSGLLPSNMAALSGGGESFDFLSLFGDMAIGGKNSGLGKLFGSFGSYTFLDSATEHLLFQAYIQEHFYRHPYIGEDITGQKPSALSYEQEYLLFGKASDQENLYSIINRLILIRTILDFTSLLGDKVKWSEAKTIAVSLVGFTGLPILVSITQTILVVLLAFAEALVDTSALLQGKQVPILKNKVNLGFADLAYMQREVIQSKAAAYPEEKGLMALSYRDYLIIFLLLKGKEEVSYRCMDLIQENLRIRYEDNFSMQNCLFGFEVEAEFSIKSKFVSLPFVRRYIKRNHGSIYSLVAAYSY